MPIAPDFTTPPKATAIGGSNAIRNIGLGENERFARNPHHALIRAATGRRRQLRGEIGNVGTDDGKIAAIELPNVWATVATGSAGSAGMRVRAKSFFEHGKLLL